MTEPVVVLEGISGLFTDERFLVSLGRTVTVGRSRRCEVSAAMTRAVRRIGRLSLERTPAYRKLSRRHFRVHFESVDRVVVTDLSKNGVHLSSGRVQEVVVSWQSLSVQAVVISFGEGERLSLRAAMNPSRPLCSAGVEAPSYSGGEDSDQARD